MKIGMLWFNNDPNIPVPDRIAAAVAYYRAKYGRAADTVYAHPATLNGVDSSLVLDIGGDQITVAVRPSRSILPNHFWVGLDNNKGGTQ